MDAWLFAKYLHLICVVLSFAGFITRGGWMLLQPERLEKKWVKILPHCIDTLLLASAVFLAVMLAQYPFTHPWLTAKVCALLVYIGLGLIALRFGRTRMQRAIAWLAALGVFGYIVAVALSKNPFPFYVT